MQSWSPVERAGTGNCSTRIFGRVPSHRYCVLPFERYPGCPYLARTITDDSPTFRRWLANVRRYG